MSVIHDSRSTSASSWTASGTHRRFIHALPTELLRQIFTHIVADCKTPTNLASNMRSSPMSTDIIHPPLTLSQTCHRWRDIALDMPELWTAVSNIVVGTLRVPTQVSRHLVALCLSRAKRLALSVLLTSDTRAVAKLAPHMDHIRSLQLIDFPDPCKLDPLMRPALALECFLLSSPSKSSISNPRASFMRQAPVLFAGNAPSLRALALLNPPFLPRQPFPTLTDLHIGRMSKPGHQDLLELLRSTPALESLAVIDPRIHSSIWLFDPQHQGRQPVPLPRLRRFALVRAPLTPALALLADLALPRDAAVHLLGLFADRHVDPLASPLPQLAPVADATTLELVVCGGGTLSFRTRVCGADGSSAPVPRVRCAARRGTASYGWWRALWQTLPCAQLTTLRVAIDADDGGFLPRFLDAAIALATLELRLHPRDENVFAHPDGAPQALLGVCALLEQQLPVVCPFLAELAVIDASSTERAWDGFLSGDEVSPRVAYVPDILCVVAARAAAGRGLRRVALQGLWRRAQRDRVKSAFAMGAAVADFEFRELDVKSSPLFEFEEDQGEEVWVNEHWTYELPKDTLPWDSMSGSG